MSPNGHPTVYVQLDSWHELGDPEAAAPKTRCGLEIPAGVPASPTLPLDDKSCESCLRLARHDEEASNPDADNGAVEPDPE